MTCPLCDGDTAIEYTTHSKNLLEVRRRRRCLSCRHTFRTMEYYAGTDPDVPAVVRDIDLQLSIFIEQMQHIRDRVRVGAFNKEEVASE